MQKVTGRAIQYSRQMTPDRIIPTIGQKAISDRRDGSGDGGLTGVRRNEA